MTATPTIRWSVRPHAGYYINSVAVSADGQVVAAGTFFHDYAVAQAGVGQATAADPDEAKFVERMLPAATRSDAAGDQHGRFGTYAWNGAGQPLLVAEFDGWQGVYWVDVSANGRCVASCGWKSQQPYAGFIGAWSLPDGQALLSAPIPGRGNMVSLDQAGLALLAGADRGYLFQRSRQDAKFGAARTIALGAAGDTVVATAISADGSVGLLASYHGEIVLFGIGQGQLVALGRWQLPDAAYTHYAVLSADGRRAYAGAGNGVLYAFDVARFLQAPGPIRDVPIPGGARTIYGLACDARGARVAIAGNLAQGGIVATFLDEGTHGALSWTAHSDHSPNCLGFDASGDWLALADGHPDGTPGAFYLWNARSGALQWQSPTGDMSWPIRIAGNASTVVGGSDDGWVSVFAGPAATPGGPAAPV